MIKITLSVIGWILLVLSVISIGIRLFAPDEFISMARTSRNIDYPVSILAFSLIFIGMGSIIEKLDQLSKQNSAPE
jgi:hypothetical protein